MKAEIALEQGITSKRCYIVINDAFYIRISKEQFKELYDYLFNKEQNDESSDVEHTTEMG